MLGCPVCGLRRVGSGDAPVAICGRSPTPSIRPRNLRSAGRADRRPTVAQLKARRRTRLPAFGRICDAARWSLDTGERRRVNTGQGEVSRSVAVTPFRCRTNRGGLRSGHRRAARAASEGRGEDLRSSSTKARARVSEHHEGRLPTLRLRQHWRHGSIAEHDRTKGSGDQRASQHCELGDCCISWRERAIGHEQRHRVADATQTGCADEVTFLYALGRDRKTRGDRETGRERGCRAAFR